LIGGCSNLRSVAELPFRFEPGREQPDKFWPAGKLLRFREMVYGANTDAGPDERDQASILDCIDECVWRREHLQ
jgi:hypothetical protein